MSAKRSVGIALIAGLLILGGCVIAVPFLALASGGFDEEDACSARPATAPPT